MILNVPEEGIPRWLPQGTYKGPGYYILPHQQITTEKLIAMREDVYCELTLLSGRMTWPVKSGPKSSRSPY